MWWCNVIYVVGSSWLPLSPAEADGEEEAVATRRSKSKSMTGGSVSSSGSSLSQDNLHNSKNPFRSRRLQAGDTIRYCRQLPRLANDKDPLDYKDNMLVKSVHSYSACIQPSVGIHHVPSKKEVTDVLLQLTRKQILCYQARIIESGALIKALRNTRHETPGFQAILSLHKAFVDASAINMNPFLLSKGQIFQIIQRQVPWLETACISRLLSSYDTTNTGLIRYPRISCTLLACFETAMINIATALDRNKEKWSKYFVSSDEMASLASNNNNNSSSGNKSVASSNTSKTKTKSTASLYTKKTKDSFKHGDVTLSTVSMEDLLTEDEWKDFRGEIFILRFLHQFYAECSGFVQEQVDPKKLMKDNNSSQLLKDLASKQPVAMMKIEDLRELFACCVMGTDDEQIIDKLLQPMVQYLFEKMSKPTLDNESISHQHLVSTDHTLASTLNSSMVLGYTGVKSLFSQLAVTIDDLIDAILLHPLLLREFIRQIRAFREPAQPYIFGGSKPIEEAISIHSSKH